MAAKASTKSPRTPAWPPTSAVRPSGASSSTARRSSTAATISSPSVVATWTTTWAASPSCDGIGCPTPPVAMLSTSASSSERSAIVCWSSGVRPPLRSKTTVTGSVSSSWKPTRVSSTSVDSALCGQERGVVVLLHLREPARVRAQRPPDQQPQQDHQQRPHPQSTCLPRHGKSVADEVKDPIADPVRSAQPVVEVLAQIGPRKPGDRPARGHHHTGAMTTLITGASSGLGAEMARQFADRGDDLALCARRTDRLEELRADIQAAHPGPASRSGPSTSTTTTRSSRSSGLPVRLRHARPGRGQRRPGQGRAARHRQVRRQPPDRDDQLRRRARPVGGRDGDLPRRRTPATW